MKKILVTGASGFVGKYLKNELDGDIVATDYIGPNVVKCDITDPKAVDQLIKNVLPDEVYHLAGISSPREKDDELIISVNVCGTKNLLESIKRFSPKSKILLISSGYVYGSTSAPANEKTPAHPNGAYAKSKLAMEALVRDFPGLHIVIARPFTHSGKGQGKGFFFPDVAEKIIKAKQDPNFEIELYNPETKRDFLHVKDVVKAYKLLMEHGKSGEIYNICSSKRYIIKDMFEEMCQMAGLKKKITKEIQHGIVVDLIGDNRKIMALGWKPKLSIDDIIRDFI